MRSAGTSRPPRTDDRYAGTSSAVTAEPKVARTTPSGAMPPRVVAGRAASWSAADGFLVDEFGEAAEMVARRLREHAVAEVEDVSGPAGREREDLPRLAFDDIERREHHPGIEVALDAEVADPAPRLIERQAPVDADDVRTAACHRLEEMRGRRPEVDRRHARLRDGLKDPSAVREHVRLIG